MIDLLLATPEVPGEPELVQRAGAHGLHVVRRCVDAVDLLAAAATDGAVAVAVSAALPRLAPDVVERVTAGGRRVVGLAVDEGSERRLRALGVLPVLMAGPTPDATLQVLADACRDAPTPSGVWPTPCWDPPVDAAAEPDDSAGGSLIAVWGPIGAPGRTTVAIGLAQELAADGRRVLLVDADTYGPSVSLALGVVDDASGLLVACRHADAGTLAVGTLTGAARRVHGSLHLLTGLSDVERWPELRPGALERVWSACRRAFDVTVVDVGFCLERDPEPGPWGRVRNASAVAAVAMADHVVAVADGSGAGAARVVAAWPALQACRGAAPVTLARNRATGTGRAWRGAVRAAGVDAPARDLPADPKALERCWRRGRTLAEAAPRSRLRRALGELAALAVSG